MDQKVERARQVVMVKMVSLAHEVVEDQRDRRDALAQKENEGRGDLLDKMARMVLRDLTGPEDPQVKVSLAQKVQEDALVRMALAGNADVRDPRDQREIMVAEEEEVLRVPEDQLVLRENLAPREEEVLVDRRETKAQKVLVREVDAGAQDDKDLQDLQDLQDAPLQTKVVLVVANKNKTKKI